MRTSKQTPPALSGAFDPQRLAPTTWLQLGRAAATCQALASAPLPLEEGTLMAYVHLLKGTVSSAALDGNGLGEEQVDRLIEGSLHLPPSQAHLGHEVLNLVRAFRWTEDRSKTKERSIDPWSIQLMHAQVLKGLGSTDSSVGVFRTTPSGDGHARLAAEEVQAQVEALCTWLNGPLFQREAEEEVFPYALLKAILAHFHLLRIRPFDEANGRTARLLQHQLLLNAGIPAVAAHRFTMHAGATRSAYERETAAGTEGDPTSFINYLLAGAVDGLNELWAEVQEAQHEALHAQHMAKLFDPSASPHAARQLQLAQALKNHPQPMRPGQVPKLSVEVARLYARLNPKTLQRDLAVLQEHGLLERNAAGIRAIPLSLRAFGTSPRPQE